VRWAWLILAVGCGRLGFDPIDGRGGDGRDDDGRPSDAPLPCTGAWGAATALTSVNSADNDWDPALSPDGQTLLFVRSPASSGGDVYIAKRQGATFSAPVRENNLSSANDDVGPTWSADGSTVYIVSNQFNYRLYTSTFDGTSFGVPVLVPELSTVDLIGPALSPDQLELYYTNVALPERIFRARRTAVTSPWVVEGVVAELVGSGNSEGNPSLSPDGLTIYFESDRIGSVYIFSATRADVGSPFATPVAFAPTNSGTLQAGDADVSFDGATLLFDAQLSPGILTDLYMIQRACP
jgi:hypothetical protein